MSSTVVRVSELSAQVIDDLISGRTLVAIVPGYCAPDRCRAISAAVNQSDAAVPYTHELHQDGHIVEEYFGVDRIGTPFNSTYTDRPEATDAYYADAIAGRQRFQRICDGPTPIDQFAADLDAHHEQGAEVGAFEGRPMLAGIVRITRAELSHQSAEEPHYDALPERYAALKMQLAANIYLDVPEKGGALEVWDHPAVAPDFQQPEAWRAQLPQPVTIQPEQGDLVVFSCRRPHAITSFEGKDRISCQVFIGYQEGQPLQLWN
jgi:hypothetical protein